MELAVSEGIQVAKRQIANFKRGQEGLSGLRCYTFGNHKAAEARTVNFTREAQNCSAKQKLL